MNTLKNKIKTILVLIAVLGIQAGTVIASVTENSTSGNDNLVVTADLFPVTPKVADFSDVAPGAEISVQTLAPITPSEAEFEEFPTGASDSGNTALAPITPAAADFND